MKRKPRVGASLRAKTRSIAATAAPTTTVSLTNEPPRSTINVAMGVRERILDAALILLHEQGVNQLTQPKLSKAAGVTQGHLTYYFPTRADLLLAVAQHSLGATIAHMVDAARTRAAAGVEHAAAIASDVLTDKQRVRMMLGLIVASDEDPKIKALLRKFIQDVRRLVTQLFNAFGASGDPEKVALLHVTMVGLAVVNLARDDSASRRETAALARRMFRLMLGEAADARPRRSSSATKARKPHSMGQDRGDEKRSRDTAAKSKR